MRWTVQGLSAGDEPAVRGAALVKLVKLVKTAASAVGVGAGTKRVACLGVLLTLGLGAAPARAGNVEVRFFGTLVPFAELVGTTGATEPGEGGSATLVPAAAYTGVDEPMRLRLTQGTSGLGFGGSADLVGPELKVIWQVESGVPLDGDPVLNTFASRNSHVGLTGSWGTVFFGIWDSPYKWATLPIVNPLRAGFVPDYTAIIGTPGFGVPALNINPGFVANPNAALPVRHSNASFYRRDANVLQYWSPSFYGVSMRLSYAMNELATPDGMAGPGFSPDIFSGLVSYDRGPLHLRYAAELHRDYFGLSQLGGSPGGTATNSHSSDLGQQLVAMVAFDLAPGATTRLVANAELLSYRTDEETAGAVEQYDRAAFYGLVDQSFGAHHVWAAYGQALAGDCNAVQAACSTDGLGGRMMTLGYLLRASEFTDFYASAYRVDNGSSASYGTFPPAPPVPAPGASTQAVGLGMLYRFSVNHAFETP